MRAYPWPSFPRLVVALAVPLVCRATLPHPDLWALVPFGVLPVALADRGPTRAARAERCLTGLLAAVCGLVVGGLASAMRSPPRWPWSSSLRSRAG